MKKEVIAFLNTDGGNIFIGVDDKGNIKGLTGNLDLLQRTIKDRIKDNIMPSALGLFDVILNEKNGKKYIQIIVAKGNERPYYLRGMGMTPDSCFIRIGSSVESMNQEDILGVSQSLIADGSIVENAEINLKEVIIAGKIVCSDVRATVSNSLLAPLLLGNEVLDRAASYTIDNVNKTIIFKLK